MTPICPIKVVDMTVPHESAGRLGGTDQGVLGSWAPLHVRWEPVAGSTAPNPVRGHVHI